MELQHTHTWRVTMTRSRCSNSARASIKTTNTFDTIMVAEVNAERDATKKYAAHSVKRPENMISSAAKPVQITH